MHFCLYLFIFVYLYIFLFFILVFLFPFIFISVPYTCQFKRFWPGFCRWQLVGLFESQGLSHHPHHAAGESSAPGADLSLRHGLSTADLFDNPHLEVLILGLDVVGAHHLCHFT